MAEHVNRESVERRTNRLLDDYGDLEVREEREVMATERFADLRDYARDGYLGGGYAWVVREPERAPPLSESMPDEIEAERRVLMILGRGASRWGLAGGGREAGETFEDAAVREVREETGVDCEITDCFLLRRRTVESEGSGDTVHLLSAFFDAAYTGGHVDVQPGELDGAAWFADPPARLHPENAFRAASFWDGFENDENPLNRE